MSTPPTVNPPEPATLDEGCRLMGGASSWRTHAAPDLDVPALKLSDGPNGVRGEQTTTSRPAGAVVPVGLSLGATWDPSLVERVGRLLGTESQRRGAHVLLGPTVNLVRVPVSGRAFECYSEDPELTARLAVGFIRGVQSEGVAATVKHFVGNDSEIERMTVDASIDEATLREVYLRPFEAAVREAGVWAVMSAYNRLHGEFCAQHRWLLTDLLRDEWGFDGVVISDWGGAHDTVGAALGGLTLAMPGPRTVFGDALVGEVRSGRVPPAVVDARVSELRRLAARTGAATRDPNREQASVDDPAERALCREAAVSSMVLLRNVDAALPLAGGARVAVIGPNAAATRIMGGGSSSLRPLPAASILDALRDRVDVVGDAPGASIDRYLPVLDKTSLRSPDGRPGLRLELRNGTVLDDHPTDEPVAVGACESTALTLFGEGASGLEHRFTATMVGEIVPARTGEYEVGVVIAGAGRVTVGDTVVVDDPERRLPRSEAMFGFGSTEQTARVRATAGVPIPVRLSTSGRAGTAAMRLGWRPVRDTPLLDEAVLLAADADVAVVVVGTNDDWETEGTDRTTLSLPGSQDELVRRVAATGTRTIVVVNAGGPVTMPWLDDVDALLVAGFAGIETGPAVAEIVSGITDPGGRLPVTYPARLDDSPAWPFYAPVDGVQRYGEGREVGYRGHLRSGTPPAFPFGHGLSYGTTGWADIDVAATATGATVSVRVVNAGDRAATDVVQVYLTHPHPAMPALTLAGFAKTATAPGTSDVVTVNIDRRALERWDTDRDEWVIDDGERELVVARSADDEVARVPYPAGFLTAGAQ